MDKMIEQHRGTKCFKKIAYTDKPVFKEINTKNRNHQPVEYNYKHYKLQKQ